MIDVAARALGYAAALVCVGAIPARGLLHRTWSGAADADAREAALGRATRFAFGASLLLPVVAFIALRAQASQLVDDGETLGLAHYQLALASGWAVGWKAQAVAALLAVVAWIPRKGGRFFGPKLGPLAAITLAVTFSFTGHPRVVPVGIVLGVLTGALHFLGAGLWLGTLAVLAVTAWSGGAEGRPSRVLRIITGFSPLALSGAAMVGLTGVITGWQTVGTLGALFATSYGRTLLIKLGLLTGVAALGAYNWRVLQPRLDAADPAAAMSLRGSALVELSLGALLLIATAVLVALPAPGIH